MSEITLQWIQLIKILILAGAATLYGFGGVRGKWKRRFIAPFLLTGGILWIGYWTGNFSWLYSLWFIFLAMSFSMGYGTNSKLMKWTKSKFLTRAIVGLLIGISALPIAIPNNAWLLLGLHIFFCVMTSSVLGAWNPTKSARAEETTIGFIAGFIPMMGMV